MIEFEYERFECSRFRIESKGETLGMSCICDVNEIGHSPNPFQKPQMHANILQVISLNYEH